MSLGWVIVGTIMQLQVCVCLFLMVVSSASSMGAHREPGRMHMAVLNACMLALPATAVLSAVVVIFLYFQDASSVGYLWYALPLVAAALYMGYVLGLARRGSQPCMHGFVLRRR